MQSAVATRIEACATVTAAASLAAASAYAVHACSSGPFAYPGAAAFAAGTFLLAAHLLNRAGREQSLPMQSFTVSASVFDAPEELLLTERHRVALPAEPLELDDILAELGPDSRVVRLFDRAAMPTPAQLKSRIDAHLASEPSGAPAPDASQALHDALAELRRSMR